jgi:hypothetical protein
MEKIVLRPTEVGTKLDHYSVLARMVAAVSQDHGQLRMLIYEFARTKLRRDLYRQFEAGDWSGIEERVLALEAAIDQVEADFAHIATPLPFVSEPALNRSTPELSTQSALILSPDSQKPEMVEDYGACVPSFFPSSTDDREHIFSLSTISERNDRYAITRLNKQLQSNFWWTIQLIVAVVLGVAIYAAIDGQSAFILLGLHRLDRPTNVSAANASNGEQNVSPDGINLAASSKVASRPGIPNIPVPSSYGVYAVSNGQLTELDLLPIRVPDQRVAISTSISTPSRAHLPIGQLQFVVFRRDLASDAPDRVAVRVVAQVVRALTFDPGGKPTVTNVEGSWVVRSNSYQMRVAPVADNPEVIVIRPEHAELVFPAGRYALVLKGVAYDFTLDGPLTDSAHCLERTDALNAPIYTECRNL